VLAETCVFGKQLHGFFRCGPATLFTNNVFKTLALIVNAMKTWLATMFINTVAGQTLSRSYGRCIAEFLKKGSLVRLGLLDLSTCVGLRYGWQ
jgi:hypothetical protein